MAESSQEQPPTGTEPKETVQDVVNRIAVSTWAVLNVMLLLHSVFFLLPIPQWLFGISWLSSTAFYTRALLIATAIYALTLMQVGVPGTGWDMARLLLVVRNDNVQYGIVCLCLVMSQPVFGFLMAISIYSFYFTLHHVMQVYPSLQQRAAPLVQLQMQAVVTACMLEFSGMFSIIASVLYSGGSGIMTLFVYYQFLNHRYTSSTHFHLMMDQLGVQLDTHARRYLPLFLQRPYWAVRSMLYSMAMSSVPQPTSAAGASG